MLLRYAGAAALAGTAVMAGRLPEAHADDCFTACQTWLTNCQAWCRNNKPDDLSCAKACRSYYNICADCCAQGGDSTDCVPGELPPPESAFTADNGLLVAAELGYTGTEYGMLRARTDPGSLGPWETMQLIELDDVSGGGNRQVAIVGNNGLFVSAELGYGTGNPLYGMLRARSSSIGPWETFALVPLYGNGLFAYALAGNNGLFVSAELGYGTGNPLYGMLRARSGSVGPWEQYQATYILV